MMLKTFIVNVVIFAKQNLIEFARSINPQQRTAIGKLQGPMTQTAQRN